MIWEVSTHAVERFMERIRPDLGFNAARALIGDALRGACRTKERTERGRDLLYRSSTPDGIDFLLVVRPDARTGAMVVVTVLLVKPKRFDLDLEGMTYSTEPDLGISRA